MATGFLRISSTVLVTAVLAGVWATAGTTGETAGIRPAPASCNLSFGHMGPITGAAAVLGQEQLKWGRFALANFNRQYRAHFRLVEGDDQLNAAQGVTVAQRMISDSNVMAIVGPAGSQVVRSTGKLFADARMAIVSMSGTDSSLSDGDFPTFFRVNAHNGSQAPAIFLLITKKLKAKKVFIVDDQTPDKAELANTVAAMLRRKGVNVQRQTVNRELTDFSSLVSKVSSDTDVVFLSWQIAASGQLFGQQMREQGKRNQIVGANGLYSPNQFTIEGAYVSSFAPDIRYVETSKKLAATYQQRYGDFGTYGPPTYLATQTVLHAMYKLCKTGKRPTRAQVLAQVRKTNFKRTILGTPLTFAKNGNSRRAVFFLFRVVNGKYQPVSLT